MAAAAVGDLRASFTASERAGPTAHVVRQPPASARRLTVAGESATPLGERRVQRPFLIVSDVYPPPSRHRTTLQIKDQRLTVQIADATATVTIAFTVVLFEHDMNLGGGFLETVSLTGPLASVTIARTESLPITGATEILGAWELPREHTFRVPRYPAGPLATVRFNGNIEIWPAVKLHDEEITNEGVLPARYPLAAVIADVVRAGARRVHYLIVGR